MPKFQLYVPPVVFEFVNEIVEPEQAESGVKEKLAVGVKLTITRIESYNVSFVFLTKRIYQVVTNGYAVGLA